MNAGAGQAAPPRAHRRRARLALGLATVAVALGALLWLVLAALPSSRAVPALLARIGASMDLEISARGDAGSRLGARPTFVVRDLVVRQPGAARPLLQARRLLVAVPWRTLRGLGEPLELARIELDRPRLDLPALQQWLAARPPGDGRWPTVTDGVQVAEGRIDGDGWRVESLRLSLPQLRQDAPLRAQGSGRYVDASLRAPFALATTLQRPASGRGFAVAGAVAPGTSDWRLPAWITLSGALHWDDGLQLLPARLGSRARLVTQTQAVPFTLGVHGPLRSHAGAWTLLPARVVLRGEGLVPDLDAHGNAALGRRLVLQLDGEIARWPEAWPALPPPLGQSQAPLALEAGYRGAPDLSAPLSLRAWREDLRFDGRLDLPALLAWSAAAPRDSLLPPLQGRVQAQRIDVSGAQLHGVVVEFSDASSAPEGRTP